MKNKYLSVIKATFICAAIAGLSIACSNTIDVNGVDESGYNNPEKPLAFLTDKYGVSLRDSLLFNVEGTTKFYVNLTAPRKINKSILFHMTLLSLKATIQNTKHDIKPYQTTWLQLKERLLLKWGTTHLNLSM